MTCWVVNGGTRLHCEETGRAGRCQVDARSSKEGLSLSVVDGRAQDGL